jgi:hypothetical protein
MQQQTEDRFGKRIIDFDPAPRKPRAEKLHLMQESSGREFNPRGIKCDIRPSSDSPEFGLEDQIQSKKRVMDYSDTRNGISVASLGDKNYKDTTYAPDFYKVPGLYPGSSNKFYPKNVARKKQVDFTISKSAKWPLLPRTLWSEQVQRDNLSENVNQVLAADNWEETTLKEHKQKLGPADPKGGATGGKPAAPQAAKKK